VEKKVAPKDKKLRTQMNVKFNDTSSADENKQQNINCRPFISKL
jgi:hypothetical protein